jgi:hypothetical protein
VCLMSEGLKWRNLNLVDWDMFGYRFLASTLLQSERDSLAYFRA